MNSSTLEKITGGQSTYLIIGKLSETTERPLYIVKEEGKEQEYIMKKQNHMKEGEEKLIQFLISNKMDSLTQFYDFFTFNHSFYTIQEYCTGGDLRKLIKNKSSINVYKVVLDVCYGIQQLNSLKMFHRDIKPENIVIQLEPVKKYKLCDYGEIRLEQGSKKTQNVGTPAYQAPEVIKNESYDKSVDIWSLGVIIYELFENVPLFDDDGVFLIQRQIVDIKQETLNEIIEKSKVDSSLKPILKKMLSKEPSKRPNIDEIFHTFFFEQLKQSTEELKLRRFHLFENLLIKQEKQIEKLITKVD